MVYGDNPAAVSRNNCLAYRKPDSYALVAVRLGLFRTISLTVENRLKPVFVYADSVISDMEKNFFLIFVDGKLQRFCALCVHLCIL